MNDKRSNYGGQQRQTAAAIQLNDILLSADTINAELFSGIALRAAREVAGCKGDTNKATQLRRFYDEVCLWHQKVQAKPEKYDEYLPFIKMIGAKVAYAKGRSLVDDNFYNLIEHCLKQISTAQAYYRFKTFFEAFMGFYKMHKPK